jgi:hypothetical protein
VKPRTPLAGMCAGLIAIRWMIAGKARITEGFGRISER